jgi:formylglycine-generating enzyme required for sulfatase activity
MRKAVIIGSNGPKIRQLKYAESDAARVAQTLSSVACDFAVVPSIGESANEARDKFLTIAENCRGEDTFLAYFSGHGVIDGGDLFLIFESSSADGLMKSSLTAQEILMAMRRCKATSRVLILDCCNAGQIDFRTGLRGTQDRVAMRDLGFENASFDMILASDALEAAREFEKLKGGFLSMAFCDGLTDDRSKADRDRDGAVSVTDMQLWLESSAHSYNQRQSQPSDRVPIPRKVGVGYGTTFLTRPRGLFPYFEFLMPDGIPGVVLPVRPFEDKFAYLLAKYPVTNGTYASVNAGLPNPKARRFNGRRWSSEMFDVFRDPEFRDHAKPVVGITLIDIKTYCSRLHKLDPKFSLFAPPTPAIWESAAFGGGLGEALSGNPLDLQPEVHHKSTSPAPCVDAPRRANVRGIVDLIGNVWEWCIEQEYWRGFTNVGSECTRQSRASMGASITASSDDTLRMQHQVWLKGGGFYDDIDTIDITVRSEDIAGGQDSCHADVGVRLSALLSLKHFSGELHDALMSMEPLIASRRRRIPATA